MSILRLTQWSAIAGLLSACGGEPPAPPAPAATTPSSSVAASSIASAAAPATPAAAAVQLYAMHCGDLDFSDVNAFADDGSMKGVARKFVDSCYLIRHPAGDLIWDTGVPEAIADQPNGLKNEAFGVHITVPKKLSAQLSELGQKLTDIEYVSFSHLHFDHVGNANLFKDSTWIVDADERAAMFSEAARKTPDFANYQALENAKTIAIEGDASHDVFGDGSVVIHQTPGHTPGHTVLLVRTGGSGNVLLTGDLWHLSESREKRLVPAFNHDRAQTIASMDKVEALAKEHNARVIRQHVPEDFATLPAFPTPLQ